jgi:chemotaxis protein methyltransferase CheR
MLNMRDFVKKAPLIKSFIHSPGYQRFRHRIALWTDRRQPEQTFTQFLRLSHQFDALTGPVMDFVLENDPSKTLRVLVLGCAAGSEVYSITYALTCNRPSLSFTLDAYDISEEMLEYSRRAVYKAREVFTHDAITPTFVESLFEKRGDEYHVKPEYKEHVSFGLANVMSPSIRSTVGTADVVFAQNLLFNMRPAAARTAFNNIVTVLQPRSALYIEGVDLGMRCKLTRNHGLRPLDYEVERIHNDARIIRATGWPFHYWGLEPFSGIRRDWLRRYATIFLKDDSTN